MKLSHQVTPYRSMIDGVEAMSLLTAHHFPRHSHDQFGIGIMTTGSQQSWSCIGKVESSAGDIIMVNPGEIHDGVASGGSRGWHMLYFDPAILTQEFDYLADSSAIVMRPVTDDRQLGNALSGFFTALNFSTLGLPQPDMLAVEECFLYCLLRAVEHHTLTQPYKVEYSPAVMRAKTYLDDAPQHSVSLQELADLSGISRFQLLRGFAQQIGITPHAYLIQSRVRLAKRLLASGESLADTALLAGFFDQSHLTRAFSRQLAMTPGYYQSAFRSKTGRLQFSTRHLP